MIFIPTFIFAVILLYLVEFKIKRPVYRLFLVVALIFAVVNVSIHFGSDINKSMDLNAYSRGLNRLMGKLYTLSKNKRYDQLEVYLKKLNEDLPLAIYNPTEFNDLVEYVEVK
jgi:hypothetical protein